MFLPGYILLEFRACHEGAVVFVYVAWLNGGIDPLILNLGTIWRSVLFFTPRSVFPLGEAIQGSIDNKTFGASERL
jgi:hypothetical protein